MSISSAKNLLRLTVRPTKSQTIFHYCSVDVFWSIITKKEIWLSDIFTMNDASELTWGRGVFADVVRENHGLFDDDFRYVMIAHVYGIDPHVRPLTGSFSANGDLLSQWR